MTQRRAAIPGVNTWWTGSVTSFGEPDGATLRSTARIRESSSLLIQLTSAGALLSTSGSPSTYSQLASAPTTPAWRRQYGLPEASTRCCPHHVVVHSRPRRSR